MVTQRVYKECKDYMMANGIEPYGDWKITEKSLVWYDWNGGRHVVSLKKVRDAQFYQHRASRIQGDLIFGRKR